MNLHCIVQCFVEGDNKTKNIRNLFIIYLPLNFSLSLRDRSDTTILSVGLRDVYLVVVLVSQPVRLYQSVR